MKSIDTYLCKEKKEVYKINTKIIYPQANRLYTMQETHDRLSAFEEIDGQPRKWLLRLAVAALLVFTIYEGLSLWFT